MVEVLEFIMGVAIVVLFVLASWGFILMKRDEQILWQDRKDYNKMKKEVEKNDSSRIG